MTNFHPTYLLCQHRRLLLLLVLVLVSLRVRASSNELINIAPKTVFTVDSGGVWSGDQALGHLAEFTAPDREIYNFGFNSDALWMYIKASDMSALRDQLCFLEPRITELDVYYVRGDTVHQIYSTGQARPVESRLIEGQSYQVDLSELAPDFEALLIRAVDLNKRNIPMYLGDHKAVYGFTRKRSLINGAYFGLLLVMIFYNTFIFVGTRDRYYLYYIAFLCMIMLAQSHMSGLGQYYLYPAIDVFKERGSSIFSPLAGIFAVIFIMKILSTRLNMPVYHRLLILTLGLYSSSCILSFTPSVSMAYLCMQGGNLLGSLVVMLSIITAIKRGSYTARLLLVGWSCLILGVMVYVFTELGVLPYDYRYSPHTLQLGSAFEILFFSFALAERINRYSKDRLAVLSENARLMKNSIELERETTKKIAELELTAIRSQMNPHFVFNALGAIQYYMQKNETDKADVFLTKFGQLMRQYLESSRVKLIDLHEEVKLLKLYTDLEVMRFGEKFKAIFEVDPSLDLYEERMPSMLIQPLVENSIKHGLNDRLDGEGLLRISFNKIADGIEVRIADNGVGIEASSKVNEKGHVSRGLEMLEDRIKTFSISGVGEVAITYESADEGDEEFPGTTVVLSLKNFD